MAICSECGVRFKTTDGSKICQECEEAAQNHPHHHYHLPKKEVLDKPTKIGLAAAGAFAIIVLVVWLSVKSKTDAEKAAIAKYQARVEEIIRDLKTAETGEEVVAAEALKRWEESKAEISGSDRRREAEQIVARLKGIVETTKERRETTTRLDEIEKKLAAPDSLSPDQVKDCRRQLEEIETRASAMGTAAETRYKTLRLAADKVYAQRLVDDALRSEQQNAENPRLALVRSTVAEDELRPMLDAAFRAKKQDLQDYYTPLCKAAQELSDKLAETVFAGELAQRGAWTDCLAPPQTGYWNASKAPGFSFTCENGVLSIMGPDVGAKDQAVISIGDREQWRHFLLDVEFTIERGNIDFSFRLQRNPMQSPAFYLRTDGENPDLKAGTKYEAKAQLIGSTFKWKYEGEGIDVPGGADEQVSWTKNRKGAIGIVVPPGARVKFTRFKVKELK